MHRGLYLHLLISKLILTQEEREKVWEMGKPFGWGLCLGNGPRRVNILIKQLKIENVPEAPAAEALGNCHQRVQGQVVLEGASLHKQQISEVTECPLPS